TKEDAQFLRSLHDINLIYLSADVRSFLYQIREAQTQIPNDGDTQEGHDNNAPAPAGTLAEVADYCGYLGQCHECARLSLFVRFDYWWRLNVGKPATPTSRSKAKRLLLFQSELSRE